MIINLILNTVDTTPIGIAEITFYNSNGVVLSSSSPTLLTGSINSGTIAQAFDSSDSTLVSVSPDTSKLIKISVDISSEPSYLVIDLDTLDGSYRETNLSGVTVTGTSYIVNNRAAVRGTDGKFKIVFANDFVFYTPDGLSEKSSYTTAVYLSGNYSELGKTKYAFTDSSGATFFNYFRTYGGTNYINDSILGNNLQMYTDNSIVSSSSKQKEQSSLANLYEQQAPAVVNITASYYSATKTKINVLTDKNCQVVVYIVNQDALGNEQSFRYFARDAASSSKSHDYIVDKFNSRSRVVAVPINSSYFKDFSSESEVSGVQTYNYSTFGEVLSRYQEGFDTGYKQAHQQIYPLGQSYGWDYDFNSRVDYGDSSVQSSFVQTIADNQYIGAYKEIYNRGSSYGFTYNNSSTSRTYYLGQQDSFLSAILTTGSVPVYRAIYDLGAPYGFTYNNSSSDVNYLQNLKSGFVSSIDTFSDKRGEKRAYSNIFNAAKNYQSSFGMAEGFSGWTDITSTDPNFTQKTNDFVRNLYNSGYAKAAQTIYNSGSLYGFNWRTTLGTLESNNSINLPTQYDSAVQPFVNAVTATAKSEGIKIVYDYVSTRFNNFTYDSINSSNRSNTEYVDYLAGLKQSMTDVVVNNASINVYNTIFGRASTDFLYNYNNTSTDSTYYRDRISEMLGAVYNYGTIAAYQSVYDRGDNYYFKTVTNYTTLRDSRYTLKGVYNNSKTSQLENLKEDFEVRLYESGVVFTYKRFFDLAIPYGFSYDPNQFVASYYDGKREEFLEVYRSGNLAEGIRYVLDIALNRYGHGYTFYSDSDLMKAQVVPMFDEIDVINKLNAYNYTLNSGGSYGYSTAAPTSVNSAQLKIVEMLNFIDNKSALNAFNYVLSQANTRTNYTLPSPTSSKITAQSYIVPMMKYVEDYKESDGYRRVHNYAKNFLGIGYEFQDSQDPRNLENQVPGLFDYLVNNGGTSAYKYIYQLSNAASGFSWQDGTSLFLKSQVPGMIDYMSNYFQARSYRDVLTRGHEETGFNFVDSEQKSQLEDQIIPLFDWIKASGVDIISVSEPVILPGGRVKFSVVMKRVGGLMGILKNKMTGEVVTVAYSKDVSTTHQILFDVSDYADVQNYEVVFLPTARTLN